MPAATDNGRVNGPLYLNALGTVVAGTITVASVPDPTFEVIQGWLSSVDAAVTVTSRISQSEVDSLYGVATGGPSIVTYYRKRARDSACVPVTYVYWVTTDPNGAYPNALPCGGPLVDEVIVEVFQQ